MITVHMYILDPLYIFFFNDTATTEIYTLSLHDALPISVIAVKPSATVESSRASSSIREPLTRPTVPTRSEEHTSELQSRENLVCRLLLEKKKKKKQKKNTSKTKNQIS